MGRLEVVTAGLIRHPNVRASKCDDVLDLIAHVTACLQQHNVPWGEIDRFQQEAYQDGDYHRAL
jgi:hypothetical protein